jgi:hypothetical protein
VNLLLSVLSFHFPQKGSFAAHSVLAIRQANTSEKQKRFMGLSSGGGL